MQDKCVHLLPCAVSDDVVTVIVLCQAPVALHRGISTDEVNSEKQSSEEMVCNKK